jgi:hypothetical protein
MGMVKTRSAAAPSSGQAAGSLAWLMGRETSNWRPHLPQRKSYLGILARW